MIRTKVREMVVMFCCFALAGVLAIPVTYVAVYAEEAAPISTVLTVDKKLPISHRYFVGNTEFNYICVPCVDDTSKGFWWLATYHPENYSVGSSQYMVKGTHGPEPVSCTPEILVKGKKKECAKDGSECFISTLLDDMANGLENILIHNE